MPPSTGASVGDVIAGASFSWYSEADLQAAIERVLTEADVPAEREVRLNRTDRIDFLAGRVGVEVKVKGGRTEVLRQLQRYARSDRVDELLLVTTTAKHIGMPPVIGGKPLTVLPLIGVC